MKNVENIIVNKLRSEYPTKSNQNNKKRMQL